MHSASWGRRQERSGSSGRAPRTDQGKDHWSCRCLRSGSSLEGARSPVRCRDEFGWSEPGCHKGGQRAEIFQPQYGRVCSSPSHQTDQAEAPPLGEEGRDNASYQTCQCTVESHPLGRVVSDYSSASWIWQARIAPGHRPDRMGSDGNDGHYRPLRRIPVPLPTSCAAAPHRLGELGQWESPRV
jgi:hypothetical protein